MKKNEIAILVLIVGFSALVSYFAVSSLISGSKPKPVSIDKAEALSSQLVAPNEDLFKNPDAYNPTIKVKIGDQSNQQPFSNSR